MSKRTVQQIVDVPVPQIQEQILEVINDFFERRVVVQQLLTGVFLGVVVRL